MTDQPLQMRPHAIVLRVKNLEASRAWYESTLDMTVVFTDPFYKLVTLARNGESQLAIWELRDGEAGTVALKEAAYPVFLSQDALSDQRVLTERGANPTAIEDYPNGLRMFWLSDPDGHRILVLEFLPE